MIKLPQSLATFGTNQFNILLKQELAAIDKSELPLNRATTQGGLVNEEQVSILILTSIENTETIEIKLSVFFNEIVGGCSCGDPPMQINNHCEILLEINKQTANAKFILLQD